MSKYGRPTIGGTFELSDIGAELRAASAYWRDGHTARTLVREEDIRIVYVAMKAGAVMKEHRADETAAIHGLEGHVRLRRSDHTVDLRAGQLLVLERGMEHEVEAVADSAFLLTLGWRPGSS